MKLRPEGSRVIGFKEKSLAVPQTTMKTSPSKAKRLMGALVVMKPDGDREVYGGRPSV